MKFIDGKIEGWTAPNVQLTHSEVEVLIENHLTTLRDLVEECQPKENPSDFLVRIERVRRCTDRIEKLNEFRRVKGDKE